jgi:uncharacterized protein
MVTRIEETNRSPQPLSSSTRQLVLRLLKDAIAPSLPRKTLAVTDPSPAKLEQLRAILEQMDSVLICFSGGIDSAFLLKVATDVLGERAIGMTAVSPSLPQRERDDAVAIARELGATHYLVESDEMSRADYVRNGADRCFHCKSELYSIALRKQAEWGLSFVANGTTTDDLGDYRPGLTAAQNASVRAPLVEAQMSKQDVRSAAKLVKMRVWDKPAAACLASRLPYGVEVTRTRLAQVEGLENALRDLGFSQVRVRWHDSIARIEVPKSDFSRLFSTDTMAQAVAAGKANGFRFITVDLEGYRSGSLNQLLNGRSLKLTTDP